MIVTVASGKGGTGKTTFAVNLAYALARRGERVRLLDCDVEEPNDHLFVQPVFTGETAVCAKKPVWDESKCTGCGKCAAACKYNALAVVKKKVLLFNEMCHSCGVCSYVCPEGALTEQDLKIGSVQISENGNQPFFFAHGLLNIGEMQAPRVVCAVKKHIDSQAINIIDAAPGTACQVVAAVTGADAVILVTEPTPFGLNDLKLAVGLTLKLKIPTEIIINRSDGTDRIIVDYAKQVGLPVTGRIPFSREYAEEYSQGNILVERFSELHDNLLNIYDDFLAASPPEPKEAGFAPDVRDPQPFAKGNARNYREITVISGKGGTGKTTVVAALAQLAGNKILADNDVDAADLHLLLAPEVHEEHTFTGGTKAQINAADCIGCGRCAAVCRFNAIQLEGQANDVIGKTFKIDRLACEGCGFCALICPVNAISSEPNITGRWYVSRTDCGPMVHARLGIAEENSGRLVTQVRNRAAQLAAELQQELILGDGPPGTGCPVIASVSGVDLVLIVTEPTVSGVHDLERVLKLTRHFGVSAAVVINKVDLNIAQAGRIEDIAKEYGSRVIGTIPFDRAVNDALMAGKTVLEYDRGAAGMAIRNIWCNLQQALVNQNS